MGGIQPLGNSSINTQLQQSWNHIRATSIDLRETIDGAPNPDFGRPLSEPDRADLDMDGDSSEFITYSETVTYILTIAVLVGDETTFAAVFNWARNNLVRSSSGFALWNRPYASRQDWAHATADSRYALPDSFRNNLMAWRYVPSLNGGDSQGGVISYLTLPGDTDRNGFNAASDDIVMIPALYLASLRGWGAGEGEQNEYYQFAQVMTRDAWENYVVEVNGQPIFFAGDQFSGSGEINPSYFRPAYFRHLFPMLDPAHATGWAQVADSSYDILTESGRLTLNSRSGAGFNLPPNWVRMDYHGQLTDSQQFPGVAGAITGWDADRVYLAIAQDLFLFRNQQARDYLSFATDDQGVCQSSGPICFLRNQIDEQGRLAAGFDHNGARISRSRVAQTLGLENGQEQVFAYGTYLPFFHYAGDEANTQRLTARLNSFWRTYEVNGETRGYWGNDRAQIYSQSLAWFGLFWMNGLPGTESLIGRMRNDLPGPISREITDPDDGPEAPLFQIDHALGHISSDNRPRLDRASVAEHLELQQLQEVITAIAAHPYVPESSQPNRLDIFQSIVRIDQDHHHNLIGFFRDPREYWNNVITLLSVYAQKLVEADQRDDFTLAINLINDIRTVISLEQRPIYRPSTYNTVTLDLLDAELRAQVTGDDGYFYLSGIYAATAAIDVINNIDSNLARPDYYLITRALITIGDLYLRMHESDSSSGYLERAATYYNHVINLNEYIDVIDDEIGLYVCFGLTEINESLDFNFSQGYLSTSQHAAAPASINDLMAVAQVKNAALIIQRRGERDIPQIMREILNVDRAIEVMETNPHNLEDQGNFHLSFAQVVKADLLLFLADSVKYQLWPGAQREFVEQLGVPLAIMQSEVEQTGSAQQIEFNNLFIMLNQLRQLSPNASRSDETISSIHAMSNYLTDSANRLYRQTPSHFGYLYAWAQTKMTEIAVRTGWFMDREFEFLVPYYTDEVLMSQPIPQHEFLGIEQNNLIALLLTSAGEDRQAMELLQQVISDAENLDPRYRTYFQCMARLKQAEIYASSNDRSLNNRTEALRLFQQIETDLAALTEQDLREMAWNTASFQAELYHEWGNLTNNSEHGQRALEFCYQSDSAYDLNTRRYYIFMSFDNSPALRRYDTELQTRYRRRPVSGR